MTGKTRMLVATLVFQGVLTLFQTAALAEDVSMKLTAPPPGPSLFGVYISPYTVEINGVPTSTICDDFVHDTYHDETWKATVTAGSSVLDLAAYDAIGWLAVQLMATSDTVMRGYISFAIWDINADQQVKDWLVAKGGSSGASFYDQMLKDWVAPATNSANSAGYASLLTIYSPIAGTAMCGAVGCATTTPQEFVTVRTSEPSTWASLAIDLLALVGAVVFMRRRVSMSSGKAVVPN